MNARRDTGEEPEKGSEQYALMNCPHCQGQVEFPPHGVGQSIFCPHCGNKFTLSLQESDRVPAPPPPPPPNLDQVLHHLTIDITKRGETYGVVFDPPLEFERTHLYAKDALACFLAETLVVLDTAGGAGPVTVQVGPFTGVSGMLVVWLSAFLAENAAAGFRNRPKLFQGTVLPGGLAAPDSSLRIDFMGVCGRPGFVKVAGGLECMKGVLVLIQGLINGLADDHLPTLGIAIQAALIAHRDTTASNAGTVGQRALVEKGKLTNQAFAGVLQGGGRKQPEPPAGQTSTSPPSPARPRRSELSYPQFFVILLVLSIVSLSCQKLIGPDHYIGTFEEICGEFLGWAGGLIALSYLFGGIVWGIWKLTSKRRASSKYAVIGAMLFWTVALAIGAAYRESET